MTELHTRVLIAIRRLRTRRLLTATLITGGILGLWRPLIDGLSAINPIGAATTALTLCRWPGGLAAVAITASLCGADRDAGLDREQRLCGTPGHTRIALDLACALAASLLLAAGSCLVAALVGLGGWLRDGLPALSLAGADPLREAGVSAMVIVVATLATALLCHACGWSARTALVVLLVLAGSFMAVLMYVGTGRTAIQVLHPLSGPWRLLYHDPASILFIDISRRTAILLVLGWGMLAVLIGVLVARRRYSSR